MLAGIECLRLLFFYPLNRRPFSMTSRDVPTLYEWVGGIDALSRLTTRFYQQVKADALLAPVFAHMNTDHPAHVAAFLAEVLGGPTAYSEQHGGHPHMIQQHLNRHLTQPLRQRWVALLLHTADELQMPDDPEFRSALVGYLEWGSRLAVINSQPGASVDHNAPMPKWGWGEVKGPYVG
jgi:hemoglobin